MIRKAIVIGASSGIGEAVSKELVVIGYEVVITGRRTTLLQNIQALAPNAFHPFYMDVNEYDETIAELNRIVTNFNPIDLIVISAGIGDVNMNLDTSVDVPIINTNIIAFTHIANWAYSFFAKQGCGHLAAITSVAGIRGNRYSASYCGSKAYNIAYLESLRQKATHENLPITITDIRPGFVQTSMAKGDGMFWVAPVNKAAKQILKGLHARKSKVYITKRWAIIGLLLKLLPVSVYKRF